MDEAVPALAVVDARFCAGDEAALAVAKTISMSGNDFTVTDAATGDVLLRVDGVLFSLRRRCLLADAHRRPVLTVQESALVMNKRWKVFRGDSTSRRDLLFTVVKPSVIPLRWSTKVNVFLASNDAEQAPDFRITGSYHDGACSVSLGESNTVIGKIDRRSTVVSTLLGKNAYSVTVNPGIDYAFVVALAVVLDEMHYQ
ncbi:protein LURP-one-related 15-like [Lolium rigidum]|uniref:protein LURP-one-related 15-like n=1 Tax=Lolium rigidum TaxID=89674 RepID=UPI001F5C778F|nr:protein LURP-one-related 15-like [Lolium rigidum]